MVGGGPGRFVSNGLARVLILINLRGVKLRVGLGRGVRYYKELRIRVRVGVRVRVRIRIRVRRAVVQVVEEPLEQLEQEEEHEEEEGEGGAQDVAHLVLARDELVQARPAEGRAGGEEAARLLDEQLG